MSKQVVFPNLKFNHTHTHTHNHFIFRLFFTLLSQYHFNYKTVRIGNLEAQTFPTICVLSRLEFFLNKVVKINFAIMKYDTTRGRSPLISMITQCPISKWFSRDELEFFGFRISNF